MTKIKFPLKQLYYPGFLVTILLTIALNRDIHSYASPTSEGSPSSVYLPIIYGSDPIPAYLAQVNRNNIVGTTRVLVQDYSPRRYDFYKIFKNSSCSLGSTTWINSNQIRAAKYVISIFQGLGITTAKEWVPDGYGTYNAIAQKIGSVYPDVFIDIGAHIDTRDTTPGASDNATGVAAVVELARVLQSYPNRYSWRFIAFADEEVGLLGSKYHIDVAKSNNESIKAGLILDGIGWSEIAPMSMNCVLDNGDIENRRIANLYNTVKNDYQLDISWRICSIALGHWSDNGSYWNAGYPAVTSIGGLPYTDPNFHKCGDNMSNVNIQNAYLTTMQNLAVLLRLDEESLPSSLEPFKPDLNINPLQYEPH